MASDEFHAVQAAMAARPVPPPPADIVEQRQRIDEAMAQLPLAEGRTTISVAHRLSTAEQADLVLVFDAGVLVERGSHDELVALDGRYSELYRSWLGNTGQRTA